MVLIWSYLSATLGIASNASKSDAASVVETAGIAVISHYLKQQQLVRNSCGSRGRSGTWTEATEQRRMPTFRCSLTYVWNRGERANIDGGTIISKRSSHNMRPKNVDFDNENICSKYRIQTTLLVIVTPYLKNAKYGVQIRTGHKICSKQTCP